MPISVTSFFAPSSSNTPFLLEDSYLKGGYRVFESGADRDQWTADAKTKSFNGLIAQLDARKQGMLAYIIEEDLIYKLLEDKETWEELKFGVDYQVESPLAIIGDNRLTIDQGRILPEGGEVGQVLGLDSEGNPFWTDQLSNQGVRSIVEYTATEQIESGGVHEFSLTNIGKTIMMLKLELNAFDIKVEGFTNINYDDNNPFTFISSPARFVDEGITDLSDGTQDFRRRFSFMSNLDEAVSSTLYFRFTNMGDAPATPKMTLTYLVLE
ncbi:hypothetical protein BN7874_247 [Phage NCTB]|nr:hypothetical protein BN7874_247 [Phage NCTB]